MMFGETPDFDELMEYIKELETEINSLPCIKKAGDDAYEQLSGYIKTDNEIYITRTGDARTMIKK